MEIRNDVPRVIVITPGEFVEISCEKILFVEYGEIEVIESRRIVWSRKSKSVL